MGLIMGKMIGGALAVIVVILAVILGVFYFNLDKIIIAAVEKYGSEVTKSDVTLAEVDLDVTSGEGALRGLSVGNPSGFEEPSAFELGAISLKINVANTNDKNIHITEIIVDAPKITYELAEGGNNLDALKKNIDDFTKSNATAEKSEAKSEEGSDEEGPKIIIDRLVIKNGEVNVKAPITLNKTINGALPTIELKDIGKKEGGASPEEVAAQIVSAVTDGAMGVVGKLGVGKTLGALKDGLAGAAGAATGAVGGVLKGGASGADKAVEGATGAVKNLFK
jgi:hypothetical protein